MPGGEDGFEDTGVGVVLVREIAIATLVQEPIEQRLPHLDPERVTYGFAPSARLLWRAPGCAGAGIRSICAAGAEERTREDSLGCDPVIGWVRAAGLVRQTCSAHPDLNVDHRHKIIYRATIRAHRPAANRIGAARGWEVLRRRRVGTVVVVLRR